MKDIKQKIFYVLILFSLLIISLLIYKIYEVNEVCKVKKGGCKVMGNDITIRCNKTINK
jgi:hypothetical protein